MLLAPALAGVFSLSSPKRQNFFFFIYFLSLLIFCGLRFQVGPDWGAYIFIYEDYANRSLSETSAISEIGFFLLNKINETLGFEHSGVVFFCSLIFLYGCFKYAESTPNPWLAIAVVMPYLIFIISLSGIRQACAIGLGFYLFSKWHQTSLAVKILVIAAAISFHNSAAVLLLFVLFDLKQHIFIRIIFSFIVSIFVVYNLDTSDSFGKYQALYLEQNVVSGGAFFHVLLTAFPSALYIFYRKRLEQCGLGNTNVLVASWLTLGAMPLLLVSSTGISRLTLYFSFVQMWVYPAIIWAGVINRTQLKVGIFVLVMAIFFVYFLFGAHASAYLPYQNILFK